MPRVTVNKTTIKRKDGKQNKKVTARRAVINGAVSKLSNNAAYVKAIR